MRFKKSSTIGVVSGVAICLLLFPVLLYAGTTGKISGVIKDKDTGDALPGVNIVIEGTTMGAASDAEGHYFIINVPPGNYTLSAMMIGYKKLIVEKVLVTVDLTTRVNFELEPTVLEMGESVTVTAERPLIEPDVTTKRQTVTAEMIESMPVTNVKDIITIQSGIVEMSGYQNMIAGFDARGIDQVHVRGGRTGQIAYMIDGMYVEDAIYSGMGTSINRDAINELTVITGNFDAEYGQAQASVVNIVTKEGQKYYSGGLEYSSGEIAGKLGSKADDLRDYHDVIGSFSGPVPLLKNVSFFLSGEQYFKRYNVYEFDDHVFDPTPIDDAFLSDPSNPTYQELQRQIDAGIIKDYKSVEEMKGKQVGEVLRDYRFGEWRLAHKLDQTPGWRAFGFYKNWDWAGKMTIRFSPNIKLMLHLRNQERRFKNFSFRWQFAEDGRHIVLDQTDQQGFTWTHQISPRTFYEIRANRFWKHRTYRIHGPDGHVLAPKEYPGQRQDNWFYQNLTFSRVDSVTGQHVYQGSTTQYYTRNFQQSVEIAADITSQIHRNHQIKAGGEYKMFGLRKAKLFGKPFAGIFFDEIQHPYLDDPYTEYYVENPQEAALFMQDKMEFENLIVRAGIRFDYANSEGGFWKDPQDPGSGFQIGKPKWQISPRLGIGHPITDKATFHFSYGHFFQNPEYRNLYTASSRDPEELIRRMYAPRPLYGNPHLDAQRTVAYDIGIRQQLGEVWAIDVSAWSKENSGEAGTYRIAGYDPEVGIYSYYVFLNADYGSARGIDITVEKRFSNYYQFTLNYTYSISKGNKYFSWSGYWDRDTEEDRPKKEYLMNWDQTHVLDVYGVVNTPEDFGPALAGFRPFGDFTINLIGKAHSGYPYTPSVGGQDLQPNTARRPWTLYLDAVFRKDFTLHKNLRIGLFARVWNLLDRKNVLSVFSETGSPTDPGPGASKTQTSTYFDRPHYFDRRRSIDVGLKILF